MKSNNPPPLFKTTPLIYQPLPFYEKNLQPLFAKSSKTQTLPPLERGGMMFQLRRDSPIPWPRRAFKNIEI